MVRRRRSGTAHMPPLISNGGPSGQPASPRELVVMTQPHVGLRATPTGLSAAAGVNVQGLEQVLDAAGVTLEPLFGPNEDRVRGRLAAMPATGPLPDLAAFYHVKAPDESLEELAESLRQLDEVAAAYVKPAGEAPVAVLAPLINDMAPSAAEPPSLTPDFESRQGYLNAAPAGIDARHAWTFPGGRGADVNIIDCEWGWRFTHEDLLLHQGGVVVGIASANDNHGTAVLGEYSGDPNSFGVVGICADAHASAASFETLPTAQVIRLAADRLRPGDILLLEIHRAGPDASGAGQDGYIAIEWWPDDLAAIQYAVARGVVVVEAAGNGARNLDAAIYNQPAAGFPADWRNPFNPANPSSGAIVVGAGAPPPGTHGRDWGPDRSRLDFSNYGARVDVQGWGREVTTTGYGDLQGGNGRDLWYTDQFSGTSSASPIVVGALGCVQGILRARNRLPLTPTEARQLLRSTGSPQQDAPGRPLTQRIGNRPDLRQMLAQLLGQPQVVSTVRTAVDNGFTARHSRQVVIHVHSPSVTINVSGEAD